MVEMVAGCLTETCLKKDPRTMASGPQAREILESELGVGPFIFMKTFLPPWSLSRLSSLPAVTPTQCGGAEAVLSLAGRVLRRLGSAQAPKSHFFVSHLSFAS